MDPYRVTLLDVGQGQCILLQSGGKTYMVDCGGDYEEDTADLAAAALLSQGIQKLDGLILTHYDEDHVGAAGHLLYRVSADVVILPEGMEADTWDEQLLKHHRGEVVRAKDDLSVSWDDGKITVYTSWTMETSNESSLCVLFQTQKCAILITGDRSSVGEEILLRTADIPLLDALVIGHHGAASSTGEALLAATRPKTALISVGENNAYQHPSQKVLERLNSYGCVIRRTDLEGTIIFRG
jgi:competence protein ComEC